MEAELEFIPIAALTQKGSGKGKDRQTESYATGHYHKLSFPY